jgi:hypothetical protein
MAKKTPKIELLNFRIFQEKPERRLIMKKVGRKFRFETKVTMKTLKRGLAAILAGCLLTGTLAACGGDDKEGSSTASGAGLASVPPPVATAAPTPASTAKAVKVTADVLNVRKSASTDSDVLGTVSEDDRMALLSDTPQNGWYNVQYEGGPAYVSAEFVTVIDITTEQYQQLMTVTATPTPAPNATAEPNGSPAPADGASPAPAGSDEDGE